MDKQLVGYLNTKPNISSSGGDRNEGKLVKILEDEFAESLRNNTFTKFLSHMLLDAGEYVEDAERAVYDQAKIYMDSLGDQTKIFEIQVYDENNKLIPNVQEQSSFFVDPSESVEPYIREWVYNDDKTGDEERFYCLDMVVHIRPKIGSY